MIQTLITRRLRQLHSKMSDHYDLLMEEPCDYEDWPSKHNRLLQIKGDMHHIKKAIEVCQTWEVDTGATVRKLAEIATAAAIIILTILGLIYL